MSIEIDEVSFTYSPGTVFKMSALKDINATIDDGEYVGVMGKTGCGKSTLIQLLVGLMQPSSGHIRIDDEDINARDYNREELRRKVGIVFQYPEVQLFETTVEKDVAFGLKHSKLSNSTIAENVRWAIDKVGLDFEKVRALSPFSLSGGEKRRVAIAGILAAKPKTLILDEPIAGLDPVGRDDFIGLTKELHSAGVTIIMVSHNADALTEFAERVIVLESGRIILDSPIKEAFRDVDFLREKGIGISQAREISYLLKAQGFPVPQDINRYDELLPYLIAIGKGESK